MKACEREIVRTMVVEFFFEQLCKSHDPRLQFLLAHPERLRCNVEDNGC